MKMANKKSNAKAEQALRDGVNLCASYHALQGCGRSYSFFTNSYLLGEFEEGVRTERKQDIRRLMDDARKYLSEMEEIASRYPNSDVVKGQMEQAEFYRKDLLEISLKDVDAKVDSMPFYPLGDRNAATPHV